MLRSTGPHERDWCFAEEELRRRSEQASREMLRGRETERELVELQGSKLAAETA
jgi:hypothetical protein